MADTTLTFAESVNLILDLDPQEILERASSLVVHPSTVLQWTGRYYKVNAGYFASPFTSSKFGNGAQKFEHYRNYLKEKLKDIDFVTSLLRLRGDILTCSCPPRICHGHLLALVANFDRIGRLQEVAAGSLAETNEQQKALIRRVKNEINPPPPEALINYNPAEPKIFRRYIHEHNVARFAVNHNDFVSYNYTQWSQRPISVKFEQVTGHNDEREDPSTVPDCRLMSHIINGYWDRITNPRAPQPRTPMMAGDMVLRVNTDKMRLAEIDRDGNRVGGWMTGSVGMYRFFWYCPPIILAEAARQDDMNEPEPITEPQLPPIRPNPNDLIDRILRTTDDTDYVRDARIRKFDPLPAVQIPIIPPISEPAPPQNNTNEPPVQPTLNTIINTSVQRTPEPQQRVRPTIELRYDGVKPTPKQKPAKKERDELEKFLDKVEKTALNPEGFGDEGGENDEWDRAGYTDFDTRNRNFVIIEDDPDVTTGDDSEEEENTVGNDYF